MARPAYVIDPSKPSSDLLGSVAAGQTLALPMASSLDRGACLKLFLALCWPFLSSKSKRSLMLLALDLISP